MNDYLNHKWKRWSNDARHAPTKKLSEGRQISAERTEERTLTLPIPQISEKWGDPSSIERQEVEKLLARVARGGTIEAKIDKINNFVNSCKGDDAAACARLATSTILSRLMALEIFSAIVYDFGASTQGFLFEVFMAAMLGKDAQQVIATQQRSKGERGDIADILDIGGEPMSLKFFKGGKRGGSKAIGGSIEDLINSIVKYGKPMSYLVAIKETGEGGDVSAIAFYKFTIGASSTEAYPLKPELTKGIDIDIFAKPSWTKETKFEIPVTILTGKKKETRLIGGPIAVLNFGSQADLKQVANNYAEQLGTDVTTVYNALEDFSKNINRYLIRNSQKSGEAAVGNAQTLAYRTKKIYSE